MSKFKITSQKNKNRRKNRRIRIIIFILILLVAFIGIDLYRSNNCIKITDFTLQSEKVQSAVRLGVISDLHGKTFGDNNDVLLKKIRNENPQIILAVGDMISKDCFEQEDIQHLADFVCALQEIAPVYYVLGNHEQTNPRLSDIKSVIADAGAVLLEDEYRDINIGSAKIRLGGISYYRFWDTEANAYLEDFTNTDTYKVLMCHFPEFYQWGIKDYPIDLTVSGHTHGGMIKLPLIGPLYAPEQSWFPEYGAGLYEEENGILTVTTGLGSSPSYLPRLFNRPEIMIIDLV